MELPRTFVKEQEEKLSSELLENGYVILPVENIEYVDAIRDKVASIATSLSSNEVNGSASDMLNKATDYIERDKLNIFRLKVIEEMNAQEWFRPTYYKLAETAINSLVGNELVMQRKINLSIQLPNDNSSLLHMHADTWSGDSPFEIVVWLPLVDCYGTKGMYILPPDATQDLHDNFHNYGNLKSEDLYQEIKSELVWIEITYGNVLLFNQCLPHGTELTRRQRQDGL